MAQKKALIPGLEFMAHLEQMNKRLKTTLIMVGTIALFICGYVYRSLGNPYPRFHLIGTDYMEHSGELYALNEKQKEPYYLIKRYRYSKDVLVIGFGGEVTRTDDFYALGIADKNKKEVLPPRFEFIYALKDHKTKEVYLKCMPYKYNGTYDGYEYYKIENNIAIPITGKKHY